MSVIDEIQNDLACPNCQYNLRGLHGAVVNCPECGRECDVAELVNRRWTKPWHQAPGMTTVYMPVVVSVVSALLYLLLGPLHPEGILADGIGRVYFPLLAVMVWSMFVYRAWEHFDSGEGLWLALLSHIIFAFYIAGVFGGIWTIGTCFSSDWTMLLGSVPLVGLVLIAQLGERFIAGRCIRRYLNRPPGS